MVIILSACNKGIIQKNDYLIFGHYYGECLGETCVETFKLIDGKLLEDQNDNYAPQNFDFVELSDSKYQEVNDIIDFLPDSLLIMNDATFGCPDCHDQGGLFIRYFNDGDLHTWQVDQQKSAVPTYLHEFVDKVNEKITLINN